MPVGKVPKDYWDRSWEGPGRPGSAAITNTPFDDYVAKRFDEYLSVVFHKDGHGKRLLEIGCARSKWLPYFTKKFGFEVYGIDYSEVGCQQSKEILARDNVAGNIVCADFFSPPELLLGIFDFVISFGVAEHFDDTAECIAAFSKFLRPGGMLVTVIPNLSGWTGAIQRKINKPVFDIHVPLNKEELRAAHDRAGLEVISCDYFMFSNFGVCNLNGIPVGSAEWVAKKLFLAVLVRLSYLTWLMESVIRPFRANRLTSPFITCVAVKHATDG